MFIRGVLISYCPTGKEAAGDATSGQRSAGEDDD